LENVRRAGDDATAVDQVAISTSIEHLPDAYIGSLAKGTSSMLIELKSYFIERKHLREVATKMAREARFFGERQRIFEESIQLFLEALEIELRDIEETVAIILYSGKVPSDRTITYQKRKRGALSVWFAYFRDDHKKLRSTYVGRAMQRKPLQEGLGKSKWIKDVYDPQILRPDDPNSH